MSETKCAHDSFDGRLNRGHRDRVAELLVGLGVSHGDDERVREALQTRPLTGRHLSNALTVDWALDVRLGSEVTQPLIDHKIALSSHSANDDRTGDVGVALDIKPESVTFRGVTVAVANKGLEISIREVILRGHDLFFLDISDRRNFSEWLRELESARGRLALEANNEDPFTVLGDPEVSGVHDLRMHVVAEVLFQCLHDRGECASAVMTSKALHVFEKDCPWRVVFDDPRKIEEERSSCVAETTLEACNRKRLAGEAASKNIVFRYFRCSSLLVGNLCDVSEWNLTEVRKVGLLGRTVPFGAEHTSAPGALKGEAKPPDAGEEVDEREATCLRRLEGRSAHDVCTTDECLVLWREPTF